MGRKKRKSFKGFMIEIGFVLLSLIVIVIIISNIGFPLYMWLPPLVNDLIPTSITNLSLIELFSNYLPGIIILLSATMLIIVLKRI